MLSLPREAPRQSPDTTSVPRLCLPPQKTWQGRHTTGMGLWAMGWGKNEESGM